MVKYIYITLKSLIFNPIIGMILYKSKIHPLARVQSFGSKVQVSQVIIKEFVSVIPASGLIILEPGVLIERNSELRGMSNKLQLGRNTTINKGVTMIGDIIVGDSCLIAQNVFISSRSHLIEYSPGLTIREQEAKFLENNTQDDFPSDEVLIGQDVWIGAGVVILPGVRLGDGVIVSANSVVTESFGPNLIIGGIPAQVIRNRIID